MENIKPLDQRCDECWTAFTEKDLETENFKFIKNRVIGAIGTGKFIEVQIWWHNECPNDEEEVNDPYAHACNEGCEDGYH